MSEPAYITIVYRITHPAQPRALLEQAEWSAASHTHAIQERDQLQGRLDAANKARNELAAHVDDLLKQRDHWYARLLAEVNKRNKTGETA